MLQWLKRRREPETTAKDKAVLSEAFASGEIRWRADTSLPIPDWRQQLWPEEGDDDVLHSHANGLAAAWLDATTVSLADHYARVESENFMLLSALEPRATGVLLNYLERSRKRVLATLAAAISLLGMSLEELAAIVLGPGTWKPDPVSWTAGTEKGQF